MSGPFPGMDPYLESRPLWKGVHTRLITRLGDYLAGAVDPTFVVGIEERVYISHVIDDPGYPELFPDVLVARTERPPVPAPPASSSAAATISPSVLVDTDLDLEIHDPYLVIRNARSQAVVTTIEVLSPANKVKGSRGRKAMRAKQRLLRHAQAHLMEIDLLRVGERERGLAGLSDYCVTVLRSDQSRWRTWFFNLRDRLPVVGVPLSQPFPDLPLPLQAIFDEMYDHAHYDRSIDYTTPVPPPPLQPADAAWVKRTIDAWHETGRREH